MVIPIRATLARIVYVAILVLAFVQLHPLPSSAQSGPVKSSRVTYLVERMFADVPLGDPSYRAIERLRSANIITGYPDGYFAGKRVLTRYEFAVALDTVRLPAAATRNRLLDESVAVYNYLASIFQEEISALGDSRKVMPSKINSVDSEWLSFRKLGNDMPNWPQFSLELKNPGLELKRDNPFATTPVLRVCYFSRKPSSPESR